MNTIPNFTLTLPLKTEKFQEDILDKKFNQCRMIYNACIKELHKRYNLMRESKAYQKNCKYKGKDRNKIFNELNKKYNLTEYSLHKFIKPMNKHFNIDSMTNQKIATRAFSAFEGLIYHKAKKVKFKAYGELNSIEGKTNIQGIRYRDKKVLFNGLIIPVTIKNNDNYALQALENPIKYCRIKREIINGKYHYYVQLILDGIPPMKLTKQGEIKGQCGNGRVGIDIGTSTIAYSSQYEVKLLELAPEIGNIDRKIKLLQRKMDRSRRSMNPYKYNENGTINIHNRDKWIYSNRYMRIKNERKELYRKQKELRKQSHNRLINQIIILGNEFYVEIMNYKALQSRSKKTEKNDKGKFKKKKRFGKNLANKAPSMFLTLLDNKLKWNGTKLNKIDTFKVKASQYNHITNEYVKKDLNERWNDFGKFKIQRDLYSSFLIMNVKDNLKEINRELCFENFDVFKQMHDIEIQRIINSGDKRLSSMGI